MALIEDIPEARLGSGRFRREADLEVERAYVEHRGAVFAMLRAEFPRLEDAEEIYQEAWAELLDLRARSQKPVANVRALLKTIAWRRAVDSRRRRRPDTLDPQSDALALAPDGQLLPDEQVQRQIEAARLRLVIDALDPREAAVIKLKFDRGWSARQIQVELGVTAKRLEKIVTSAYSNVLAAVQLESSGESALSRR